jgi:hypothetical protein
MLLYNRFSFSINDKETDQAFKTYLRKKAITQLPWLGFVFSYMAVFTTILASFCKLDNTYTPHSYAFLVMFVVIGYFVSRRHLWTIDLFVVMTFTLNSAHYVYVKRSLLYTDLYDDNEKVPLNHMNSLVQIQILLISLFVMCCSYVLLSYLMMILHVVSLFLFKTSRQIPAPIFAVSTFINLFLIVIVFGAISQIYKS